MYLGLLVYLFIILIYHCLKKDLPITSYFKLIDWWLLVISNVLVITLGFHTYLAYINNKAKEEESIDEKTIMRVKPIRARREDMDENQTSSRILLKRQAAWLNMVAKIVFIVFLIIFNVVFWIIALLEHLKSADDIMSSHFSH